MSSFTLDNPVFRSFAFYATASTVKMMAMAFLTVRQRFSKKVFSNPEDIDPKLKAKKGVVPVFNDEDVERVRRNHLNDMENIIPFVLVGTMYVAIAPDSQMALNHFRVFFFSRVLHTLAYQVPLPQPSRALSFLVGLVVNFSMATQVLMATW